MKRKIKVYRKGKKCKIYFIDVEIKPQIKKLPSPFENLNKIVVNRGN